MSSFGVLQTVVAATCIDHAVEAHFTSSSDVNLIVGRASLLQVFRLNERSDDGNNAALCLLHRIEEATDEDAQREVATNLLGPLWCARAAIPYMRTAGRGDIVNISSESVRLPFPYLTLYAATKAGLETFSEGLRSEVRGYGIRVTVLRSGNVAGGEIARNWDDDHRAQFFETIQKTGHAAFAGQAISPETTARALINALSLPAEANVDMIEVRAI